MLLNRNKIKITLKQKKSVMGYIFILPFLIGFLLFFIYPLINSIIFSVSELRIMRDGYSLNFIGLDNYKQALFVHPNFIRTYINTFSQVLTDIPVIIAFSLFAAVLLNQKFKGRVLMRTIFFLPLIMGSGIVLRLEARSLLMQVMQFEGAGTQGQQTGIDFLSSLNSIRDFLLLLKLPEGFLVYIISAVDRLSLIIRSSAVQILIFLAGLQSIPGSLYEVAKIEGANAWDSFWKITFPLISPLILTNLVYTIIDSYASPHNQLLVLIRNTAFGGMGYTISVAMSWIFFITIFLLLVLILTTLTRYIYYQE